MQTQMEQSASKDGILFYLFLLTLFFFLLEVSFFVQCTKAYLSDISLVSYQIKIPFSIVFDVMYFLYAQILLHIIYVFIIWFNTNNLCYLFKVNTDQKLRLAILLWAIGILTIIVANQTYFPNSKFSNISAAIFFAPILLKITWLGLFSLCSMIFITSLVGFFIQIINQNIFLCWIAGFALVLSMTYLTFSNNEMNDPATAEKPNIIVIGFDSLRPDFLGYFGAHHETPFFDKLLGSATVFNESVTPLARTFPSWTSILTGYHPRHTGVRFNLSSHDNINFKGALPVQLKARGYKTIYATDETRFSNMDKNFGFDKILSPPIGLADFLIGTFNDFPLSNLFINTSIGHHLFPFSYANRPVFHTYLPSTFLQLIENELKVPRDKPVLLTTHFCLTHYPYLWASLPGDRYNVWQRYAASVEELDKQLQNFFKMLEKYQLLNHSIVVFLSDHGEALEFQGDRITEKESYLTQNLNFNDVPKFYPPSLDVEEINQSAGHGTDVLGLSQYHTLLAFKLYGLKVKETPKLVTGIVSLLDIKPTILALMGLDAPVEEAEMTKGQSLKEYILGSDNQIMHLRHIFLESDFSPESIRTVYPEMRNVFLEGVRLFKIDPLTAKLTVKEQMGEMIIKSKQYADIYGEWMLALYPQDKSTRMPILINLNDGRWTNDLNSSFALQSPAHLMLTALKEFYGEELA